MCSVLLLLKYIVFCIIAFEVFLGVMSHTSEDRGPEDSYESTAGLLRRALTQIEAYPQGRGLSSPLRNPTARPAAQLLLRQNQDSRRMEPRMEPTYSDLGPGHCDGYLGPSTSANFLAWPQQQSFPDRSQYHRQAPLSAFPLQLQMRDYNHGTVTTAAGGGTSGPGSSRQDNGTSEEHKGSYYLEHRRLFGGYRGGHGGYQPSSSVSTRYRGSAPFTTRYVKPTTAASSGKGKGSKRMVSKSNSRLIFWKKEVVCLRSKNDCTVPNVSEKIALAKLGLQVKEVKFDLDGDFFHLDAVLKTEYPELTYTGGYCLMRPLSNSRDLTVIDPPKGGFTVRYLEDILRSARLYVRPLQADIKDDKLDDEADQSQVQLYSYHIYTCS